ncbi:MAG: hypothetical protein MJ048_00585 [Acidaminococcaceae bacterium]|nr:hypothetical protein [Acidaminococcaceae bacterium]
MDDICKVTKIYLPTGLVQNKEIESSKITNKVDEVIKFMKKNAKEPYIQLNSKAYLMLQRNCILIESKKKITSKEAKCVKDGDEKDIRKNFGNVDKTMECKLASSHDVRYLICSSKYSVAGNIFCIRHNELSVYDRNIGDFCDCNKASRQAVAILKVILPKIQDWAENKEQILMFLKTLPKEFLKMLLKQFLKNSSQRLRSSKKIDDISLFEMFENYADYLYVDKKDKVCFDIKKYEGTEQNKNRNIVKDYFLKCDEKRANLDVYDETVLTSAKKGHWDLYRGFCEKSDGFKQIMLKEPFWGRNPNLDCLDNAVCAIDFGTSSTVVACRNKGEKLLRVGKGNHSKAPMPEDYENPTVIELKDWGGFFKAYNEKKGRPFTEWNQVVVSHQAKSSFEAADSIDYSRFFAELKQWANNSDRVRLLLVDANDKEVVLPNFLKINNKQFNPIEIYAYYLGLYINNMTNKICLQYVLSFPVKYSKEVREKIRLSFEKGIKKSLPETVLNNREKMDNFEVYYGASEPAAYAVCALNELNLVPSDVKTPVYFAVFDFGGGTTDFDFGMMRLPDSNKDKGQYNFIVENFATGGEINLGGEKILNLVAYEVYKNNKDDMREKMIPIALPIGAVAFAGSEKLIGNTDASYTNLRSLSGKLRKLWEHPEDFKENSIKVDLFVEGCENKETMELRVEKDKLEEFIKKQINVGIDNFIISLEKAFMEEFSSNKSCEVHILLAGNSCKSKYVQELFTNKIDDLKKKMQKNRPGKNFKNCFVLHLPLEEKNNNQTENKQEIEIDCKKTGKTGVAFGLLACRKGGHEIKMVNRFLDSNEGQAPFLYFLGKIGMRRNFEVAIGLGVEYKAWAEFIKLGDDENSFEIYYTTNSLAQEGSLSIDNVDCRRCHISYIGNDHGGIVYLRKIAPQKIEFVVAADKGAIENKNYLAKPVILELE